MQAAKVIELWQDASEPLLKRAAFFVMSLYFHVSIRKMSNIPLTRVADWRAAGDRSLLHYCIPIHLLERFT